MSKPEYGTPAGDFRPCLLVAYDIAQVLLHGHQDLSVMRLTREGGFTFKPKHVPEEFEAWGEHFVCVCDGTVYDPMLDQPVPLNDYCEVMFGMPLPMRIHKTRDQLKYLLEGVTVD
ncbi:MAG: hypothetical protein WCS85_02155 [Candidatus Peribacteraceae bacterium]